MAQEVAWDDPASVTYFYKGEGRERPRWMRHLKDGWELPGVTTVLGVWDKGGLINWAADLERKAVLEAAEATYQGCLARGPMPIERFVPEIEGALGSARVHVRKKEQAGDIGKSIHERVQWELNRQMGVAQGPVPVVGKEVQLAFMAWEALWGKAGITPLRVEQPVWSLIHGYAGTTDLIALRNADQAVGVVDLKSSKSIYAPMHMQVAGYCEAVEERTGLKVEWAQLWRLPKSMEDLTVEVRDLTELKVWNGRQLEKKSVSREALFAAFLGVLTAWRCTCSTEV